MPDHNLSGSNFIAGFPSALGADKLFGLNASTGESLEPGFHIATEEEILLAGNAAGQASDTYAALPPGRRAEFLEAIATEIEAIGDALLERANLETALPIARLTGERGRTCGQLRMFAKLIREGSWVDARIDPALPDRTPLPRPDLRRMLIPTGPIAVFGASNFPLAFSVAGGDTASALAAGCPVIVKAHPAHPGTSEMVASAINRAAAATDVPAGVFSMLHGEAKVAQAVVQIPELTAVGFTGSYYAGQLLVRLASKRDTPIPVYAEMGSENPVFVLPGALEARGEAFAAAFAGSLTLGVGQFCTNPGLLIGLKGDAFAKTLEQIAEHLSKVAPGTMLTPTICQRYNLRLVANKSTHFVNSVFVGDEVEGRATPSLFSISGREVLDNLEAATELFGPSSLAIIADDEEQMLEIAQAVGGQLTATIHSEPSDKPLAARLLPVLAKKAGRVISNGFPTGVEVTHAMHHGGPWPSTSDGKSTSVGTAAIYRWVRAVAYQDIPDDLLPAELQRGNPLGIWRLVDGELSKSAS